MTYNFEIVRGSTFEDSITIMQSDGSTPVNLTGATAKSILKRNGVTLVQFALNIIPLQGVIERSLTPLQSGALILSPNTRVSEVPYDCDTDFFVTYADGTITRYAPSRVRIVEGVSK
jgi:hypothetical protein